MKKIITCAYCNGMGKDPFNLLSVKSDCLVCNGIGKVEVEEPTVTCAFCSGTGKNPLGARVSCIVCKGEGQIHCESDTKCTYCDGTGKSSDNMPCLHCKGIGFCD